MYTQKQSIERIVENLQSKFILTDFEALQIATKAQFNSLFDLAFLVSGDGPSALEAMLFNQEQEQI